MSRKRSKPRKLLDPHGPRLPEALRLLRLLAGHAHQSEAARAVGRRVPEGFRPGRSLLSHWESGQHSPRLDQLLRYFAGLGFPLGHLDEALDLLAETGSAEADDRSLLAELGRRLADAASPAPPERTEHRVELLPRALADLRERAGYRNRNAAAEAVRKRMGEAPTRAILGRWEAGQHSPRVNVGLLGYLQGLGYRLADLEKALQRLDGEPLPEEEVEQILERLRDDPAARRRLREALLQSSYDPDWPNAPVQDLLRLLDALEEGRWENGSH